MRQQAGVPAGGAPAADPSAGGAPAGGASAGGAPAGGGAVSDAPAGGGAVSASAGGACIMREVTLKEARLVAPASTRAVTLSVLPTMVESAVITRLWAVGEWSPRRTPPITRTRAWRQGGPSELSKRTRG